MIAMAIRARRRRAAIGSLTRRHDALPDGNADDSEETNAEEESETREQRSRVPRGISRCAVASAITGTVAVPAPAGPSTVTTTR